LKSSVFQNLLHLGDLFIDVSLELFEFLFLHGKLKLFGEAVMLNSGDFLLL
jgi:hypothetical protein